MAIKLKEEEYRKLKEEAKKNNRLFDLEKLNTEEKEKLANDHADSLIFNNDEEKQFYIVNFLIPDDKEFRVSYLKFGKNVRSCAEYFSVTDKIIFAKALEFSKYCQYMTDIKCEKDEKEMVEIIGTAALLEENDEKQKNIGDSSLAKDTLKAISKVNQLIESNNNKDKKIDSLEQIVEQQQKEIKKNESIILNLREVIEADEKEILDNKQIISKQEEDIEEYCRKIRELSLYKEEYEKLISYLSDSSYDQKKA